MDVTTWTKHQALIVPGRTTSADTLFGDEFIAEGSGAKVSPCPISHNLSAYRRFHMRTLCRCRKNPERTSKGMKIIKKTKKLRATSGQAKSRQKEYEGNKTETCGLYPYGQQVSTTHPPHFSHETLMHPHHMRTAKYVKDAISGKPF